jgi:chloramphenicol O-acetyltransferase
MIERVVKLWVDDVREPPNDDWVWVKNYVAASMLLTTHASWISTISLDHDLGEDEETGYDLLNWMEWMVHDHDLPLPQDIRIHTANPAGRENMERARDKIVEMLQ